MALPLFRREALDAQGERSLGDVIISAPPASYVFTALAVLIMGVLIVFSCFGDYTRKAHVTGYLAPDQGLIKIYAPATGTLVDKRVTEGQPVKQGDTLFILSTDYGSSDTPAVQQAVIASLKQQRDSLNSDVQTQDRISANQKRDLQARLRDLENELTQVDGALNTQAQLLASAEETAVRYGELVAKRFAAELQLREKRELVLQQKSRLESLRRERSVLARTADEARRELAGYDLQSGKRRAALERDVEALNQQLTESESRRSIVISAPAAGTVTAILAERGQTASPAAPLLTILPAQAVLEAQLLVPSRAIGFIATGQNVALRYQAFPYQRFGSARGRIKDIAKTLITPGETTLPVPLREPVYRVTVTLHEQSIKAYRQNLALQSGMLLDADVWLDKRRIIEWIFDPLYSVTGKL